MALKETINVKTTFNFKNFYIAPTNNNEKIHCKTFMFYAILQD